MPRRAPSICCRAGCGALVQDGSYCDAHRKERQREHNASRPESDRLYGTARWKNLRRVKLTNKPLCEECERQGRVTQAALVDHIKPVRDGGSMWSLVNLQSLCTRCHDIKTAYDLRKRN